MIIHTIFIPSVILLCLNKESQPTKNPDGPTPQAQPHQLNTPKPNPKPPSLRKNENKMKKHCGKKYTGS